VPVRTSLRGPRWRRGRDSACNAIGSNLKVDRDPENIQHVYQGIETEKGHLAAYEITDAGLRHTEQRRGIALAKPMSA
jgi:hypothetical protein